MPDVAEDPDAGCFYVLRMRLRRSLAPLLNSARWTPIREDAWRLLNEVEELTRILAETQKRLDPEDRTEYAYKVRTSVLRHQPAYKHRS